MELKFSANLRESLVANNMTQLQLANSIGTTQATINRWLHGINEPDLSTLLKICIILHESPNSLLGFTE